jgi:hypothetical protein
VKESLSKDAWEEKRSNVAVCTINATVGACLDAPLLLGYGGV